MMQDNKNTPLVSVAMGTYNGARWIERAIDSILSQTYQNFEIIICDDCSTDNTVEIVSKIALKDNRVKLIRNQVNSGLNISLNNCIEVSRGVYIARMDDDDVSHTDRFEKQVNFLESHPQYAFVGCSKRYFDEGGVWGESVAKENPSIFDIFISRSYTHPTVMIRRDALEKVGRYSTDKLNRRGQDFDLWCKLYEKGYYGYNIPESLFDYYESKISISRRKVKYRIDHVKKQFKWRKRLGLPISYMKYPIAGIVKCLVPNVLYRLVRKRRFK